MDKSDILFKKYYKDVFRFLRGLSADEHLSEELTQETFYRADIIKDLLSLYVEDMVSEKSKETVDTHLSECEDCRKIYKEMTVPEPQVQFDTEPAKSFQKYVKKKKWSFGWKVALVSALIVLTAVIIRLIMVGGLIKLLAMDSDSYQGFVYALTDGENQIIYVEIIFCNYFMDLDYEKYIDADYLPVGFDATSNNPYRKKMLRED